MNIYLDYFSSSRISGWSDIKIEKSNKLFLLNKKNNKKYDITEDVKYLRQDVNDLLGIENNIVTGFDISLFDKFNDRVDKFSILYNENIVWSYNRELRKLYTVNSHKSKMVRNTGSNQVLVVYKENSWLHNSIKNILSLQKNYFNKNFTSGISYYFCSISDLSYKNISLNTKSENLILVTEMDIYREVIIAENNLSNARPIVFDEYNKLETDFFGLRQALISLSSVKNRSKFDSIDVFKIFDALTAYSRMFFPIRDCSYIFIKGIANFRAQNWARNKNSKSLEFDCDVAIFYGGINRDLEKSNQEDVCILARSDKIIRMYDLLDLDTSKFMKFCYRRGLKVKIIEGEH